MKLVIDFEFEPTEEAIKSIGISLESILENGIELLVNNPEKKDVYIHFHINQNDNKKEPKPL